MKIQIPPPPQRETTLNWPQKKPLQTIDVPKVQQLIQSPEPNTLLWGDNLDMLGWLLNQNKTFKLIYLDPPFASAASYGKTFNLKGTKIKLEQYNDCWTPTDYLQFLYVRLQLLYELLDSEGLLCLHIDDNIGHEAKILLDELFGRSNFRSEIIWELGTGAKSRKTFSIQHNTLYLYSKSNKWTFNSNVPEVRIPFSATSLKTHFRKKDDSGRAYRERTVNGKKYIYYADEGKLIGSVWSDISSMLSNSPIISETTGYPTQKPEKLLRRIIAACTNPNDSILDPFCGSGTTLIAAQQLNRNFTGIDQNGGAILTAIKRLSNESYSLFRAQEMSFDLKASFTKQPNGLVLQKLSSPLGEAAPALSSKDLVCEMWLYEKTQFPQNPVRINSDFISNALLKTRPVSEWIVALWDHNGSFQMAPLENLIVPQNLG